MRIACSIVIATALLASGIASAETLAPGKPGGVHAAQMGNKEWLVIGGVGLALTAVLVANAGSGDHAAVNNPASTVINTTATTS